MTEIETGEGKLYLATVVDLFSRRLLGYATGARHDAELVVAALYMAATTRGADVRGVIKPDDHPSSTTASSSAQFLYEFNLSTKFRIYCGGTFTVMVR
ncbi:DDE-type integrase/transposase/recombinase [Streptomyces buecherae]|uniref:DDE-type integrase/transposase/recombinase n=1 Tax=Streptomyces buecherae TaxID=2763006 RepID=UPI003F540522